MSYVNLAALGSRQPGCVGARPDQMNSVNLAALGLDQINGFCQPPALGLDHIKWVLVNLTALGSRRPGCIWARPDQMSSVNLHALGFDQIKWVLSTWLHLSSTRSNGFC